MSVFHIRQVIALIPLSIFIAGCGETVGSRMTPQQKALVPELRKKFVLQDEPRGERTVSSVRKLFLEPEDPAKVPTEIDVVIRGRIHNGKLPPWETGKTAFMLTDATGHSGEADHDPHTCPFCSRNIEDYVAEIGFRDKDRKLYEIDSRDAFGVKQGQLLLIKGTARMGDDILKVEATGMYFVKEEPASKPAAETAAQE